MTDAQNSALSFQFDNSYVRNESNIQAFLLFLLNYVTPELNSLSLHTVVK
jgi:hypothetical protein